MRWMVLATVGSVLLAGGVVPVAEAGPGSCEWTQWGQSATHTGQSCGRGPSDPRLLTRMVVDPFAAQEEAESFGALPVHFPVPLVDDDGNVFVLRKGGTFVPCDPPGSGTPAPCGLDPENIARMTWSIQALRWQHGQLVPRWTYTSAWKPIPLGGETLFQSAMSRDDVYVPEAGGTVVQLDKSTGRVERRIGVSDPGAFVSGGLTVDGHGTLYYNVIKPATRETDTRSWLVRATRNRVRTVDYGTLIPDAPDQCYGMFPFDTERPLPPPPQPDGSPTLPESDRCGPQRAALNLAPAVGADGRIITVTKADGFGGDNYGYVVALNPDLSLAWVRSLRGLLNDGCGVLVPYGTGAWDCRPGTALGVDTFTNLPPAAGVNDFSTASPVILPDGGVVYGTRSNYNAFRGHLMKFDHQGRFVTSYDFGWDITPAVVRHGRDYSLIIKDNNYLGGGPYHVTRLSSDLRPEWKFTNTETRTCERLPDGTISCVDDGEHQGGFEWCISAPAVDRDGTVYGLSEDGNLYVIDRSGQQRARVFLSKTVASAYTPVSLDNQGHVYAQNNGELYVLGR